MKMINKRSAAGFTLVETSIVLVILGLIAGAVSIGVNLQRSAEHLIIKQKFIDGWVIAYNEYYKRTGTVVGDDQTQPTYMVAGLDYNYSYLAGAGTGLPTSSDPDGVILADGKSYMVCEGDGHSLNTLEALVVEVSGAQRLHELMDRHGIRMPAGRAEGQEDRYVFLDNNGNPQELQVCFSWFPAGSAHGSGNAMVIRGLTPDMARQIDRMIDGNADAMEGRFRQMVSNDHTDILAHQRPNREWTGVNSIARTTGDLLVDANEVGNTGNNLWGNSPFNDSGYGATLTVPFAGAIRDEDQVMRVTAVYLMDW
jgi:prepilin-type N-terminal cleavage/methylation domain-containing protein